MKTSNNRQMETISTSPIQVQKSLRYNHIRAITSAKAGKVIPLAYVPLLRGDRAARGRLRVALEMMETAETLMNAINVTVYAHFVPFVAMGGRFTGMEHFNRAWGGVPEADGDVTPLFNTHTYKRNSAIYRCLGIQLRENTPISSTIAEAYNEIVNFRRRARSTKLTEREAFDKSLAEAFWKSPMVNHIVPDFDQAMIDGEVPVNLLQRQLPVKGLGIVQGTSAGASVLAMNETGNTSRTVEAWGTGAGSPILVKKDDVLSDVPDVFAELTEQGITLSLSNIELAKQTVAFAKLRKKYQGYHDDHIIDLLMQGVAVPDQQLMQPWLLDKKSTLFGYNKRHATDGANLEKSVTTGETFVDLNIRTPETNCGGLIMITAEIVPEQMFERMTDPYLGITKPEQFPNFTRDYLDPEKVSVVPNAAIDCEHSDPEGIFGYEPLNQAWKRNFTNVGGKFMREPGDPFNENRQRIWAVETTDPVLNESFYLTTDLHHNVFADTESDPFEIITTGSVQIVGNTVFGRTLDEDSDDYETVNSLIDGVGDQKDAPWFDGDGEPVFVE